MKFRILIILVLALSAILAAGLNAVDVASAQDDSEHPYVDLVVQLEELRHSGHSMAYLVKVANAGTATAYDVEIKVLVLGNKRENRNVELYSSNTDDFAKSWNAETGTARLAQVKPGSEEKGYFSISNPDGITHKVVVWSAEAKSQGSYEAPERMHNNLDRRWHVFANSVVPQVEPNYSVAVTTEGYHPDNDRVNLIVTASVNSSISSGENAIMDARVNVELTPGLEEDTTKEATFNVTLILGNTRMPAAQTWNRATGVFSIGETRGGDEFKMTLPARITRSASSEPLCVTATITAQPPTGPGDYLDDPSDNVAKVCLGVAPAGERVVLRSGTADLFTWYDCVGKSASPCDQKDDGDAATNDDLQLVVFGGNATEEYGIFQPSQVVVHVPDPAGRTVNTTGGMVWSTGFENWGDCTAVSIKCLPGDVDRPGVVTAINLSLLNYKPTTSNNDPAANWGVDHPMWTNWHTGHIRVTAVVPMDDQGNPLGEIKGWRENNLLPDELFWGNNVDSTNNPNPTLLMNYNMYLGDSNVAVGGWRAERYIEFSALGTYLLTVTTTVAYDDDGDSNTVTASHSDTETYTFHVGPLADLSVADGGASSHTVSGRSALTVVAANNGPDLEADAEVKIALPTGAQVEDYVASEGTYANGVWTLPGLKSRDYRRSAGKPEPATLTLILKAGGILQEPAEATISLTDDVYTVCIGSNHITMAHDNETDCEDGGAVTDIWYAAVCVNTVTNAIDSSITDGTTCNNTANREWTGNVCASSDGSVRSSRTKVECGAGWHEGTVYDPTGNNTAKITAAKGTGGGGGPGSPGMRGAKSNSRSVTLAWGAVKTVNTVPTGHYEVQKYIRDEGRETWQTVSGPVTDTQWTDFNVGSGAMPPYRVRAVNAAGIGGPWSATYNRVTAQQQGQLGAPSLTARTTTHDTVRLTWTEPTNQSGAITGYELEYLSGDTWTDLDTVGVEEEREYEHRWLGPGEEWSYRVRAVSGDGPGLWSNVAVAVTPPGLPTLWAEPNGPNAILITWDPGSYTVTRFELEMSSTDQNSGYSRLANPSGTARSYSHNTGAIHPEVRYYRLRACNNAGCGDWSFPDYATTAPRGVPSAPGLTVRSSNPTEIKLSWNKPSDGGSEITGYHLEHFTDGRDWTNLDLYPATVTEYAHQPRDGFGGGTTQRYRVRAVNAMGEGAWSTVRSVTIAAGLPEAPELSFGDATDNSLTLTWTTPETNGSRISGYRVERNDGLHGYDNWVRIGATGGSVTTYTDRNLYSGEYYCYRVAATSNVGTGPYSEQGCESTTGQYAVDPDPPIARLSSVSASRVVIAWDPPADDGGRPVQSYLYEQADESGAFDGSCQYHSGDRELWSDACKMVSAGTRSATFSGLTAGSSAKFRVRAETTYSYGDWAIVTAHLPKASDDTPDDGVTDDLQLRISTTSLTVSEGREARYTVRLNKAPQVGETVSLDWYLDTSSPELLVDYEDEGGCYRFSFDRDNWNRGCTFTLLAQEDRNADDEIAIMEHSITVGGREVSGPDVRVLMRDND